MMMKNPTILFGFLCNGKKYCLFWLRDGSAIKIPPPLYIQYIASPLYFLLKYHIDRYSNLFFVCIISFTGKQWQVQYVSWNVVEPDTHAARKIKKIPPFPGIFPLTEQVVVNLSGPGLFRDSRLMRPVSTRKTSQKPGVLTESPWTSFYFIF